MNKIVLSNKGLVKELDDSVVVTFNGKMERFGIDEFSIYILPYKLEFSLIIS